MIPTRILFCTDFSDNSLDAQSTAVEYARTFGAKLIIVHVIDTWAGLPAYNEGAYLQAQDAFARMNESTRERLEDMGNQCTGVSDVKTVSRTGVPSDEIMAVAAEEDVGLIIMGTHGWTGFKHLIVGSVAEKVLRSSKVPVMVVRPRT